MLLAGVVYIGSKLSSDLSVVHSPSVFPFILLGVALFIALGFEFVNGFHDTANAVATVIYTHSLDPHIAVVWSGIWNFLGVLFSSGTVAFAIVALLPVELILKVSSGSGFAMVFALLIAAILWNLGTWYKGLPASSSHTMIGSVIGVGVANQLMRGHSGVSGVDWDQVAKVFKALIVSPIVGFGMAALLLVLIKVIGKVFNDPRLYDAPKGPEPPPFHIRCLLILTCTGVSFFHGSNDGQKGMGLIMLILVGTVPTAYALNHAVDKGTVQPFAAVSTSVAGALSNYVDHGVTVGDPGPVLETFVSDHKYAPATMVALQEMVINIRDEAVGYGSLGNVPAEKQANVRNQMYLTSETFRLLPKFGPHMAAADSALVTSYKGFLDKSTQYIPTWVKGRRRPRPRSRHHDRMEAHRDHRRREDWQEPPHLRPGRRCRDHRDDHHRHGQCLWRTRQHHPCAQFRRCGHHGGKWKRPADVHRPQHCHGLVPHPAHSRPSLRLALLDLRPHRPLTLCELHELCRLDRSATLLSVWRGAGRTCGAGTA